jgi:hypothetical protein
MSSKHVNVEYHEVRNYGNWNRIQDIIESNNQWAIVHIYQFDKVDEQWEVWVEGERHDSCSSMQEAKESIHQAKRERGNTF